MPPTDRSKQGSRLSSDPKSDGGVLPWPVDQIPHYTAYRTESTPLIDGDLSKTCWQRAPRSTRFVDLISGEATLHDTRVAVLWDDENLYVAFWVEEPAVTATLTERDSLIYEDNDVEVFIAGEDGYYEFEINAFGTVYEVFFIWDEAYHSGGFAAFAEFSRDVPGARPFTGVGFTTHPRGSRTGFWEWDYPGLRSAVVVDGTINNDRVEDRGWTVELAFPWAGLQHLADGRSLPPVDGDVWRMSFSRFNQYKEPPPATDSSGWALSAHGVWDSHIPELFPYIHFATESVMSIDQKD